MGGRWERLAARVTAERVRRGYRSISAFAEATGLSSSTLDKIENHRRTSYSPATIDALEHALGWRPGSVQHVLAGREPELDADPELTAIIELWPTLSPAARRLLLLYATEAARAED